MIRRKSKAEIQKMRAAGKVVALVHSECAKAATPGTSTGQLDALAEEIIRSYGGEPTFLGYQGFPGTICASINEEVVHGIPSPTRILNDGDLFKLDVGVTLEGLVADAALSIPVGEVSADVQRLIDVTKASLFEGINAARAGNRIGDIGNSIEAYINRFEMGIVRDYGGHGVGHQLHEEPHVPNHGRAGTGPRIKEGYCLALEPMVNLGTDDVDVLSDKWTVVTSDRKWSAHFEHSMAVTADGPLILTLPDGAPQPFLNDQIL